MIEEFSKLKQESFVMDYLVKFEELKSLMVIYHLTLNEIYFISSLISDLNDELRNNEDDATYYNQASY